MNAYQYLTIKNWLDGLIYSAEEEIRKAKVRAERLLCYQGDSRIRSFEKDSELLYAMQTGLELEYYTSGGRIEDVEWTKDNDDFWELDSLDILSFNQWHTDTAELNRRVRKDQEQLTEVN